eukprot:6401253-Amphidinium_carterae.1
MAQQRHKSGPRTQDPEEAGHYQGSFLFNGRPCGTGRLDLQALILLDARSSKKLVITTLNSFKVTAGNVASYPTAAHPLLLPFTCMLLTW